MSEDIKFYSVGEAFGEFSNFAPYPIKLDGKMWPTSEHYFQAQKFNDERYKEKIRKTKPPMQAAILGRDRKKKLRNDWNSVKINVMRKVLEAKFTQYDELMELLQNTGDSKLIEHTYNDSYWGDGGDGSGKNMLGILLMELRDKLKS